MPERTSALDALSRRLILAAEDDLRRWLGEGRIDNDLLGTLYLRVREALERNDSARDAAVDDVALTIYVTASAWGSRGEPPLDLLSSIHQRVEKTLAAPALPDGARRNS